MTQLSVEDFFDPPPQAQHSRFLTGCFCNRQDLNLHTYAWLPKQGKPTYVPPSLRRMIPTKNGRYSKISDVELGVSFVKSIFTCVVK